VSFPARTNSDKKVGKKRLDLPTRAVSQTRKDLTPYLSGRDEAIVKKAHF